ncbi:MAG: ATP-binding cassette domain-containing protein, partial [Anaerolineales bacterium]|nr:ATP-binding cassette domain-containing protein [Anaerolineales bacterium]
MDGVLVSNAKTLVGDGQGRLIELRDVVKSYRTPAGSFIALNGVNLEVNAGEFISIVGKSGSGKTTLINMLTGIDKPTQGKIIVNGVALHELDEGRIATWRGVNMGVVFQFFQLLPALTLLE